MKTTLLILPFLLLLAQAHAASVTVQWSTSIGFAGFGTPSLDAGSSADGDGALLELGYFSAGTSSSPFSGTWVVLATGSIGDQGVNLAGQFAITTILTEGSFAQPLVGTPLGIRFYNGTSVAASTFYNTGVNTDGSGLWVAPTDPSPIIQLTLTKEGSEFENQADAFRTAIPIPEVGTSFMTMISFAVLLLRRGRERG